LIRWERCISPVAYKNVGVSKLTQVLFLINPTKFWSIDNNSKWLPLDINDKYPDRAKSIEEGGLNIYLEILGGYKNAFPACDFFEINFFCWYVADHKNPLVLTNKYCQISSWLNGQRDDDYFDEFVENNAIRTGGEESTSGKIRYRLTDVDIGDIVLIRRGTKKLGGIAIIIYNEYLDGGYTDDKRIKILWLSKENKVLKDALGDMSGFNIATEKTRNGFKSLYGETFQLLDKIRTKQNVSFVEQNNTIMDNSISKNTIFYGPPGTGKTYSTINKSISIANPSYVFPTEGSLEDNRKNVKTEYERLQKEHQIFSCTFHQSLSYEDFIEGIKPLLDNDSENKLSYYMQPGIFKKACAYAAYFCYKKSKQENQSENEYLFDELYDSFIDYLETEIKNKNVPVFKTIKGKEVKVKKINSNDSIIANAKNTTSTKDPAPLTKENFQKLYDTFNTWEEIDSLKKVKDTIQIQPRTTEFYALFRGLKEFEKTFIPQEIEEEDEIDFEILEESEIIKKFENGVFDEAVISHGKEADAVVLIIDEINRGNIAAIFGELITLIESDKRWGAPEKLKVILPYSQLDFYVPINLYLIGTMNTADRSVEALDTALRRRFTFDFMPPINEKVPEKIEEVEMRKIFVAINERISYLLDEDHKIGHSYFMDISTKELLREVFKNRIIPLLKEYFYNDFGKIRLILGDGFVVKKENHQAKPKFAAEDGDFILEKTVFEIKQIEDNFDIAAALNKII